MSATAVITRYPKSVLTLLVLVTAVAMALAQRVRFENAIETWFVANDPALVAYNQFTKHFAADEIIVLAFDGDVFSPGAFALIDRLERRAAKAPYVHRVISLLDFDLDPPAPRQPESRAAEPDWDARRRAAAQNTLVTPMFVSADGRTTGLVLEISRSGNTVEGKRALVTALDAIVEDEQARSGIRILMTGTPVLDHRVFVTNERDLFSLYPFIVPVIFVICLFVFGRIADALIPLMVVGIAITWAYGLMGACGIRSTLLTSAMIPLLLAIGVADSVHVLSDYRRRAEQLPRTAAIVASVARTWRPCLFTTLTTVAGLLALLVSSLQPIREFGAMAAFGVLVSFFATMTLVPALLCVLGDHSRLNRRLPVVLVGRGLQWMIHALAAMPPLVGRVALTVGLVLGAVSVMVATRVAVGVDPIAWFGRSEPFRVATEHVDQRLGGGTALEFFVRVAERDFGEHRRLKAIDDFERWIERNTAATVCVSFVDLVKEATRTGSRPDYRYARLPEAPEIIDGMLRALAARGELERWLSPDLRAGRISCRVPLGSVANLGGQLARIDDEVARRFGSGDLRVEITGYGALMVQMEHNLVASQLRTLAFAFLMVFPLMALLIGSARVAIVAVFPNLLPLGIGLAAMPLLGISLNPGTVMVAAVALGIVVDDTVHLLVAVRREMTVGASGIRVAIKKAIEEVGAPVVVTSVLMVASLSVLTLGSFAPSVNFGFIAITIVIAALLADLLILPEMLAIADRRRPLFAETAETAEE